MKVIVEGKLPELQVRKLRGTCERCKCQVECDEGEEGVSYQGIRSVASRSLFASSIWFVACPTKDCGQTIRLFEYVTRS